jgi:hypothetical protein
MIACVIKPAASEGQGESRESGGEIAMHPDWEDREARNSDNWKRWDSINHQFDAFEPADDVLAGDDDEQEKVEPAEPVI